jgi:L-threonylcarbamoyladenylate synthase
MDDQFEDDITRCLEVLKKGGVILYPTDTIWGLGCDATNAVAVKRVYAIKKRQESKSLIILLADRRDILKYVASPDLQVFDFIENESRPTTIIFDNAVGLPENLVAKDGSVAIRIVRDNFCRHLIKRLQRPLVSTSANASGTSSPQTFAAVNSEIIDAVDYVVQWRQGDLTPAYPSQIIKWANNGNYEVIRS